MRRRGAGHGVDAALEWVLEHPEAMLWPPLEACEPSTAPDAADRIITLQPANISIGYRPSDRLFVLLVEVCETYLAHES